MYGGDAVIAVDAHSYEMVNGLNESGKLPVKVVYKGTANSSKEVEAVFKAANNDEKCVGVITWMHTFSPAKMWIHGLQQLIPFLLLIGQPQLGADAHGDLGPVLPVDIGGRFQLQCRPVQRDRYRRVDSLDGQAQGEQHGQRQHQRQEPFRYGSHKSMTSSFQDLLIG